MADSTDLESCGTTTTTGTSVSEVTNATNSTPPASSSRRILVLDTSAIIQNSSFQSYNAELWTVEEVLTQEIRDRATREKLSLMAAAAELRTREPSPASMKRVISFARQTGDFSFLSKVDLKLLALAVEFELELNGESFLRTAPMPMKRWDPPVSQSDSSSADSSSTTSNTEDVDDFYDVPATTDANSTCAHNSTTETSTEDTTDSKVSTESTKEISSDTTTTIQPSSESDNPTNLNSETESTQPIQSIETNSAVTSSTETESTTTSTSTTSTGSSKASNTEDDDDAGQWITPSNYAFIVGSTARFGTGVDSFRAFVGCATSDFAMQNVILQMNLQLISLGGVRIQRLKQWMQKCGSCFKPTKDMDRIFCEVCGHPTLRRVSVHTDQSGVVTYYEGGRQPSKKGTRFSIPKPAPGRANQPNAGLILAEDQLLQYNRHEKKKAKTVDVFDPEYEFCASKGRQMSVQEQRQLVCTRDPNAKKRPTRGKRRRR